jgi:phosphohistidine swiveling domain-containing protein
LVLLGRWAETPLETWPGYCEEAIETLFGATSVRLEPFSFLRKGLHEQYYIKSSTDPLRLSLNSLSSSARSDLLEAIFAKYYTDAEALDGFNDDVGSSNLSQLTDPEVVSLIETWMVLPGRLAAPVFLTLLLDMWYSSDSSMEYLIEKAASLRDHCTRIYDLGGKPQMRRVYLEASRRAAFPIEALEYLFPDEIVQLFRDPTSRLRLLDQATVRTQGFVAAYTTNRYKLFGGADADRMLTSVIVPALGEARSDLSGRTAYPGEVSGPAKVILSSGDFAKFAEGDILVAYQTSIPYEPLFDKAAAVLTELGGATSHAAVICAERKIPCVVGIDDLVVSVSDGQVLQVDATTGHVRVLDAGSDQ